MADCGLYLESGPKRRTTMVHVIDLLGCIANARTTEDALAATPDEIRIYLRFLRAHGERVDVRTRVATHIVQHVTEGSWIGYGDPAAGFAPDFAPLTTADRDVYLRRLTWMREDFSKLLSNLNTRQLVAHEAVGRTAQAIAQHVANADAGYLRYTAGAAPELREAVKAVERAEGPMDDALERLWAVSRTRIEAMTEDERTREVPHGERLWTARRGMRRMLEHQWEHLRELQRRFESA